MGILYAKVAGSWVAVSSSTGLDQATGDARYVNITGDTMTAPLVIVTGTTNPLRLSGASNFNGIYFYDPTNVTRRGWVGVQADLDTILQSDAGAVRMLIGTTEIARFDATTFLVGKTAAGVGNAGSQIALSSGQVVATMTTDIAHYIANAIGAAIAAGHEFISFRHNNTTIGSITRNASTSAVLYNTTSDYRLKNDLGPIDDAVERLKLVIPRRVTWKSDPTNTEVDGMFAHEVAAAVPEAVTGEKDAIATVDSEERGIVEGEPIFQQLDATKLIPLLTAALQQAHERIDALESRLAALEAA